MIYEAKKFQSNYHKFKFSLDSIKDKRTLFVCSDIHFDNPKCNRKLFFQHLDQALERNAMIAITGDFFCFMQGRYDPRRSKSDIRPEHMAGNYIDLVINEAAEKMKKYAKNILIISKGNHETSVSLRLETDVMERFIERLNVISDSNIQLGAYTGYYTLSFENHGRFKAIDIGYSHGNWGGVITKGTLSVVRYAAMMPDSDIMFSGHTHDGWIVPQPRLKLNKFKGSVEIKNQWHVKTGTYKEEFVTGSGWAVERIAMPKYLGGCWVELDITKNNDISFTLTLTH